MPHTTNSDPATLVAAARRDLEDVEAALSRGDDRLVALVVLARAARRADDAVFALLEGDFGGRTGSVSNTHGGYSMLGDSEGRSR